MCGDLSVLCVVYGTCIMGYVCDIVDAMCILCCILCVV